MAVLTCPLFSRETWPNEKGHISLYALVVLPIVCSFAVLAVDVSNYQALRDRAQEAADRIALQAAKALPDISAARGIITESVKKESLLELDSDNAPLITSSRITLALSGSVSSSFDVFLPASKIFSVQESAEVVVAPSDVVVILADAQSLRPPAGESWGDGSTWPPSKYFNFVRKPNPVSVPADEYIGEEVYWKNWRDSWESSEYRRWATQSCYNPVYSSLKFAAISVLDVLNAVSNYRTSLIFSPSEDRNRQYAVSRELSFNASAEIDAPARWFNYFEKIDFVSDEACALFADPQTSDQLRYQLPQQASFLVSAAELDSSLESGLGAENNCP